VETVWLDEGKSGGDDPRYSSLKEGSHDKMSCISWYKILHQGTGVSTGKTNPPLNYTGLLLNTCVIWRAHPKIFLFLHIGQPHALAV
jgi:hypothetical protein